MPLNSSDPFYAAAEALVTDLQVKNGTVFDAKPGLHYCDDDGSTEYLGSHQDAFDEVMQASYLQGAVDAMETAEAASEAAWIEYLEG